MTLHYPELAERVRSQHVRQPDLYGAIDLDATPYRFTDDPHAKAMLPTWVADRAQVLEDERIVELIRTATMLGDVAADPYAALAGEYGMKTLIGMLGKACRSGLDADAPVELRRFIEAMEATPDWLDMGLVEEGARHSRVAQAFVAPFLTRGAFLATFLNMYAALPMTLTGTLSSKRAAHRVNETSTFFAITTMPGALDRHGEGFRAAAMVRLMHSMVRVNAIKRSKWDDRVYGIPVPQVDQMPAGLINMYLLAAAATRGGRTEFTPRERAILEFSRYRCFLLGLPEELLPTTCEGILQVFHARAALLRDGFDDATCGELVRSTMAAYLRPEETWFDRTADSVERSWSRGFFLAFSGGDRKAAAEKSVAFGALDAARIALTAPFIVGRFLAVVRASRHPRLAALMDAYTIRVLERRLQTYGVAEYSL